MNDEGASWKRRCLHDERMGCAFFLRIFTYTKIGVNDIGKIAMHIVLPAALQSFKLFIVLIIFNYIWSRAQVVKRVSHVRSNIPANWYRCRETGMKFKKRIKTTMGQLNALIVTFAKKIGIYFNRCNCCRRRCAGLLSLLSLAFKHYSAQLSGNKKKL